MPDSQNYSFFRDNGPGVPGTFLFSQKLEPQLRPKVGDSLPIDLTFDRYTITRIEIPLATQNGIRITDGGIVRITDQGDIRETGEAISVDQRTLNYFVTPSNNRNRIVSWSSNKFAEDQVLRQLFNPRFN